ncbi:hypothetical protein [Francisella philomiragia]|uniref:hypothetical protein n=1 Tax=Francisella philomiragia TaxID=28110 RepID=UPI002244EEAF|nr:hypothetical protein [Francisella philomiragia]
MSKIKIFDWVCVGLLVILVFSLSSCEAVKGALPSWGETNSATSNDSAQVQVKPNMALSATGDSKSNQGSVDKSTTSKVDTNNDADSSTGSKNVLGNLEDKSVNSNQSKTTTKIGTDDDSYSLLHGVQNINDTELQKYNIGLLVIVLVGSLITNLILAILLAVGVLFAYILGKRQRSKRELKLDNQVWAKQGFEL